MSEKIKAILGDELYNQVIEKMGDKKFDLLDSYIPKTRFNEVNEKNKLFEEKISSYEKQIEETKNMLKDTDGLKEQYSKLQEQYSNDLKAKDKEIGNIMKKNMFKEMLSKNGAKHPDLLMKEVNFDALTIENNNLLGANEILTNIKTNYGDLFETKTTNGNEPKQTNSDNGKTWDFSKL